MTLATEKLAQSGPPRPIPALHVPRLQSGDRLSDAEFQRRYEAMLDSTKAELIEGIVYIPPPVFEDSHGGPHADLMGWLAFYRAVTPGVRCADNTSLRLDLGNLPQPDAYVRILPTQGGKTRTDERGYVVGAPELIAEIAASSANYDVHDKLVAYQRNGVREYVVWRTYDAQIDWFAIRAGRYHRLRQGRDGIYRSRVFPGLWLIPAALIRGDVATVLRVVQQGTASPEHEKFARRLQKAAARHGG
jgi:Uma2 family endonuclease